MDAFRSSLSAQGRKEKQREGSNTQGRGRHFLIQSKNKDHDQRITCHSCRKKKATVGLPAFLPFHAGLPSPLGDEEYECGRRLASPLIVPSPQLLGTIALCLWHVWNCRSWPYLTRTFILHRHYGAPQNALCVTVPFSPQYTHPPPATHTH